MPARLISFRHAPESVVCLELFTRGRGANASKEALQALRVRALRLVHIGRLLLMSSRE